MNKIITNSYIFNNQKGTYYFAKNLDKCVIEETINSQITLIIDHPLDLLFLHQNNSSKSDVTIKLNSIKAQSNIRELVIAKNKENYQKEIKIIHQAKSTFSDYKFFGFAINDSKLNISAKSMIKAKMNQSEAHQILRVLTDDQAKATAQPGLFIDNFDVKASHGNSIGQVNEQEIYYLQTKGINAKAARWMIIEGYILEALSILTSEKQQKLLLSLQKQLGLKK